MEAHRHRAPSSDGALLAEPPLGEAPSALASNADRLEHWDHDFQGRSARKLRPLVRQQVVARAREYLRKSGLEPADAEGDQSTRRLVVTGHQPELYHPGVWVKNFAAAKIAKDAGVAAIHLIVDNDIPKSPGIRVPRRVEGGQEITVERVEFDRWHGDVPYEDLTVADELVFETFGQRVKERLDGLVKDPLIDDFWPRALEARQVTDRLGLRFAIARRAIESSWGVRNLEVPLSAVCETEGFLWFVCHLLAQLPRFQEIHNDALARYRSVYGIRSHHHPVPDLGRQGEWLEAPFWVWRVEAPRRRLLLVRALSRTMELRISGEDRVLMEIPLAADREACCAVDQLMTLPAMGVRLRTRALTTTMFGRYLLGDLFLHGIGGAKYDELGDAIACRFFGIDPPTYFTLSLTMWLGLDFESDAADRLAALERLNRDLSYNPDRHLDPNRRSDPDVARLIRAKHDAIARPAETPSAKLERFRVLRRTNEALQSWMSGERESLESERARLLPVVRHSALARNREFSMVLHSKERLRAAIGRAVPGIAGLSGD
jgi:hypothetical protein